MGVVPAAAPATRSAGGSGVELPGIEIPIRFDMPVNGQTGYYRPVAPQTYQRKCGTIATDVCPTDIAVPPGATGEQLYEMAAQAEQQGRKGDALAYLLKSADKGYVRAQSAVGIDYADGKGLPRDAQKAVHYLELAAAQGSRGAEAKLGEILEDGNGVPRDEERAITLFRASAAQHDSDAEFALGVDYEFGRGVPHNRALAIQYLRQSSVDGHDTYGSELAALLAKAPASRQFHDFGEIGAYAHPPTQMKPGACGPMPTFTGLVNRYGFTDATAYCQGHPNCPWASAYNPNNISHCGGIPNI
jgi:hypothetical protein